MEVTVSNSNPWQGHDADVMLRSDQCSCVDYASVEAPLKYEVRSTHAKTSDARYLEFPRAAAHARFEDH